PSFPASLSVGVGCGFVVPGQHTTRDYAGQRGLAPFLPCGPGSGKPRHLVQAMQAMKIDKRVGFLGAGNMAEALIRGLLRGHADASHIAASGPRAERMAELGERYGILGTIDNGALVERSEIVVLSVKPQIMRKVLDEVADRIRPDALVISI